MSSRRTVRRSSSSSTAVEDDGELQATCSDDCESVYAGSSSRGSSCDSSLFSSDGYLHSADSCGGGSRHYEEVDDDRTLQLRLSSEHDRRLSVYLNAASGDIFQTESRWTRSSLLYVVSALLAACSLSSLTVCIAVTSFSLRRDGPSRAASGAVETDFLRNEDIVSGSQIYRGTERPLQASLADYKASHQKNLAARSEWAARYSWDCTALAGLARCSPVQKVRSLTRDEPLSSQHQQDWHPLRVLAGGMYYMSVQMAGKVWLAPPTLLRAVIAQVKPKFGAVNVTAAHTVIGAADSSNSLLSGAFSVYTAAAVRLGTDDELLVNVMCVEQPGCILHVNGTTSYLTLERLDQ